MGHISVVECLIESGADVNCVEKLVSLFSSGMIINFINVIIQTQSTPLHMAVLQNHISIIKYLITSGAGINAVDKVCF